MTKQKMVEYCDSMLRDSDEGIALFSEYAQFCEEMLTELLPYLSERGLRVLKRDIDDIREQMKY